MPWNILYPDRPLKTPHTVYEDLPNLDIWIRDRDRGIGTPLDDSPGTDRGGANFSIASMHAASSWEQARRQRAGVVCRPDRTNSERDRDELSRRI